MSMLPGEKHAALMKTAGEWDATGHMWMSDGADPIPVTATAHTEAILGGRYVVQEYSSAFMGQPFQGVMLMGYDNVLEEYFSVWVDSMGTGRSITSGNMDETGDLQMTGQLRDVLTPDGRPWRLTTRYVSDDEMQFLMYDSKPDGEDWKVMELTYTRANR